MILGLGGRSVRRVRLFPPENEPAHRTVQHVHCRQDEQHDRGFICDENQEYDQGKNSVKGLRRRSCISLKLTNLTLLTMSRASRKTTMGMDKC